MNKPVISICIPTYNRAHKLKRCLESICAQFTDALVLAKTEIVVSDNCSTDNTPEMVAEFQTRFPNIIYSRNTVNLGMDLNVANSVEKSSGVYCWYMGDDDAIAKGTLAFLINYLSKNEVSSLVLRDLPFWTDEDLKKLLPQTVALDEKDIVYAQTPDEAYDKGYLNAALSGYIFLREPWLKFLDKQRIYPPWLYLEVILKMLPASPIQKFALLPTPVLYLDQACEWVKNGKELNIILTFKSMWRNMPGYGYGKQTVKNQEKKFPRSLLLMLARAKGHNLPYRWADYRYMVKEFKSYPLYLFLATCLYLLPNFFVRWVRDLKKYFLSPSHSSQ